MPDFRLLSVELSCSLLEVVFKLLVVHEKVLFSEPQECSIVVLLDLGLLLVAHVDELSDGLFDQVLVDELVFSVLLDLLEDRPAEVTFAVVKDLLFELGECGLGQVGEVLHAVLQVKSIQVVEHLFEAKHENGVLLPLV